MGYTTKFNGKFKLDRQLAPEHAEEMFRLAGIDARKHPDMLKTGAPDGYNQWQPTRTLDGIEWDQGEKFYNYVEWLQWLIDQRLKPWGYLLTGSVQYRGESRGDAGVLTVSGGIVSKHEDVNLGDPKIFAKAVAEAVARGEGVEAAVLRLLAARAEQDDD